MINVRTYSGPDRRDRTEDYRRDVHLMTCGLMEKYGPDDALEVVRAKLEESRYWFTKQFWTDVLSLVTRRLTTLTGA